MSLKYLSAVYKSVKDTSSTDQAVLAYLAFCLNSETGLCYPSINTIIKNTHFKLSAVKGALRRLRRRGLIEWIPGGQQSDKDNTSASNQYTLHIPDCENPVPKKTSQKKASTATKPAGRSTPKPKVVSAKPVAENGNLVSGKAVCQALDSLTASLSRQFSAKRVSNRKPAKTISTQQSGQNHQPQTILEKTMHLCGVYDHKSISRISLMTSRRSPSDCEVEIKNATIKFNELKEQYAEPMDRLCYVLDKFANLPVQSNVSDNKNN